MSFMKTEIQIPNFIVMPRVFVVGGGGGYEPHIQ